MNKKPSAVERLLSDIKEVKIPKAFDLTEAEMEAIRQEAAGDGPCDQLHLAFQYGFMRGQKAALNLDVEPIRQQVRKIHSTVLAIACALDTIVEDGCEPAMFAPALYGVEEELQTLFPEE